LHEGPRALAHGSIFIDLAYQYCHHHPTIKSSVPESHRHMDGRLVLDVIVR